MADMRWEIKRPKIALVYPWASAVELDVGDIADWTTLFQLICTRTPPIKLWHSGRYCSTTCNHKWKRKDDTH